MLTDMGMTESTATTAANEIHADPDGAVNVHITHELGVAPSDKPSPWVAAVSSFIMFAIGGIVPLIPYLLGFSSLISSACRWVPSDSSSPVASPPT